MTEVHPEQASPAHAEAAFGFLAGLGFRLMERRVTGGNSSRDGWRLTYEGLVVRVEVQYMDAQFEVHFRRGPLNVSYLFIDRELFGRRSGLHGDMFAPQKLAPIVDRIAADVRDNYTLVLRGDSEMWRRIEHQFNAPRAKRKRLP